jgi:hypothetical protein
MLNVEFVTQFAAFGAILAGFSMSIAFSLILHSNASSKPSRGLMQTTGGAFLTSAVVLALAVFLAAVILSIHAQTPPGLPPTSRVVQGANLLFYVTAAGGLAMLVGTALSGFIRSKRFGAFTVTLALLSLVAAVVIYSLFAQAGR